jgi:hypothetical protein
MEGELGGLGERYGSGLEGLGELRPLVERFYEGTLSAGEASRLREGLGDLLTVFEGVSSGADRIVSEARAVAPSAERYGLGDALSRIVGEASSLRDAASEIAGWIRRVLGDLDAWGGA